jgi:hypothetical protein
MARPILRATLVLLALALYVLMVIQHLWLPLAIAVLVGWPWAFLQWRRTRRAR